jgi:hypothetical protein
MTARHFDGTSPLSGTKTVAKRPLYFREASNFRRNPAGRGLATGVNPTGPGAGRAELEPRRGLGAEDAVAEAGGGVAVV